MIRILKQNWPAIVLFIFFAFLYIYTAAPGVYDGDSGELAAAVNQLGLAHPTGFPLYMLTGKLFTLLVPVGDLAYRLNILSALLTAIAVVILYLSLCKTGTSQFSSLAATLVFGFGTNTIWRNATYANVYSLSLFFAALLLFIFIKWQKNKSTKLIYLYGCVLGISLGTHTVMLALTVPFLLMLWRVRNELKNNLFTAIKILFSLTPPLLQYIYIAVAYRRDQLVNWGKIESFSDFVYYITQKQYASKIFTRNFDEAAIYTKHFLGLITSEFSLIFFIVAIIGFFSIYKNNKFIFLGLASVIILNFVMLLGYGKWDGDLDILFRYIFLTNFIIAIAIAFGLDSIMEELNINNDFKQAAAFTVIVSAILLFHARDSYAYNNRADNYIVSDTAFNMLDNVEKDAVILAYGDPIIGPLWYLQSLDFRGDVSVIAAPLLQFPWYNSNIIRKYPDIADENLFDTINKEEKFQILIRKNIEARPVYAAFNQSQGGILEKEFDFIPEGILYRIVHKNKADLSKVAAANMDVWGKYNLRSVIAEYKDSELNDLTKMYALSLFETGLIYYYNKDIDGAIRTLELSNKIFPHPETIKNLEYIKNKVGR